MSSRVNDIEWISGLKVRIMENTQSKQETERLRGKNKSNVWDPWDNTTHANLCIMGVPEGKERKKETENVFEVIMAKKFPSPKVTDV